MSVALVILPPRRTPFLLPIKTLADQWVTCENHVVRIKNNVMVLGGGIFFSVPT